MIFVDVMGGLGNQLFQYATAKSLALSKNSNFMLNLDSFDGEDAKLFDHIKFKLNHFNIGEISSITTDEIYSQYKDVEAVIEPISSNSFVNYINLNKFNGNVRLIGFWQDERYFKNYEHIIKNDLKIITPPNKKNRKMLNEINETNSVCLSFRRGEYLNPYYVAQFGICTEEYYNKAITFMSNKVKNPVFYVFSDDMDWIEDNVKLDFPTVPISFNGIGNEHEELRLMTNCNHFILANSSFSWWGAWLSENKYKNVFAPTPWFNSLTKQNILCPNWIQLKCNRQDLFNKSNMVIFELMDDQDYNKLILNNINKSSGEFGCELQVCDLTADFKFKMDYLDVYDNELIIELTLYSKKRDIIKINSKGERPILLGYKKGFSKRYLHLKDMDLNDLIFNISDDSLIIKNIIIKSINSDFNLII